MKAAHVLSPEWSASMAVVELVVAATGDV